MRLQFLGVYCERANVFPKAQRNMAKLDTGYDIFSGWQTALNPTLLAALIHFGRRTTKPQSSLP